MSGRYVSITEGEMVGLIERSGPAGQYVPIVFGNGFLAIDQLEPGSEWALSELVTLRREARQREP